LYCFGRDGETVVVRVGKSYEELAAGNRISEEATVEKPSGQESNNKTQSPAAPPGRAASRPGLYSAIAVNDGFVLRRGDLLVYIPSKVPSDQ
jgi:hypothetical protein